MQLNGKFTANHEIDDEAAKKDLLETRKTTNNNQPTKSKRFIDINYS